MSIFIALKNKLDHSKLHMINYFYKHAINNNFFYRNYLDTILNKVLFPMPFLPTMPYLRPYTSVRSAPVSNVLQMNNSKTIKFHMTTLFKIISDIYKNN